MTYIPTDGFVIIAGASRGIGAAIAYECIERNINIAVSCVHNYSLLEDMKKYASEKGVKCFIYQGNMGDFAAAHEFIDNAAKELGTPFALVNNAGISKIGLLQDMSPEDWNEIISYNLTSVYNCSHSVIPEMLHNHSGRIVNISSVWGNIGASMEVAYSATKGGVNSLTKALSKELAPSNISVNAVACGIVDTDMNKCFTEEDIEAICDEIPAGRMCTPKEVAEVVLHIIDSSPYLTGQIITVDGGWT